MENGKLFRTTLSQSLGTERKGKPKDKIPAFYRILGAKYPKPFRAFF